MATCGVCFRHCTIPEGQLGFCGGRTARDGRVEAYNYGRITSLGLDPIEKHPLKRFFPGSLILPLLPESRDLLVRAGQGIGEDGGNRQPRGVG